jgi:hypothetical protein
MAGMTNATAFLVVRRDDGFGDVSAACPWAKLYPRSSGDKQYRFERRYG